MSGVVGGETQASQVSSFVGSSLNFDLENRFYRIFMKIFYNISLNIPFVVLTRIAGIEIN